MTSKESWKISGTRVDLPSQQRGQPGSWKFSARPGGWVIAESPSGERRRFMVSELRGSLSAALGGMLWQGEILRETRSAAGGAAADDSDLTARFPGKVRKVLVAPGAWVSEGDPLVLVEAMKMEFAVKAPFDGQVVRVLVAEGQQLSPGDRFVELKPAGIGAAEGGAHG